MLKKFGLFLLMSLGIAVTVGAAERVNLYAFVTGDGDAQITIENNSANVRAGKISKTSGKTPRVRQFFSVNLTAGHADVEMTVKVSGNGKFQLSAAGFGEPGADKKRSFIWIDCTKLEVNGQQLIPMAKRKLVSFSRWRTLTPATPLAGEQTFVIKATFAKTSEARAAKLNEAARKRAEKLKAKKAQNTEN